MRLGIRVRNPGWTCEFGTVWVVRKPNPKPTPAFSSDITLRQLQYLDALAREQSFSAAARRCHVSQPALAEQIAKLESRLGVLVVRGRRSASLTPLGLTVAARAATILRSVAEMERLARYQDAVRIGMIDTVSPYLMAQLMELRPERVLPVQARTHELLTALDDGRVDAVVLAAGTIPSRFNVISLGRDELLLAVPSADRAFTSPKLDGTITLEDVADREMLLLADGHCLRDQVFDVCQTANTPFGPMDAATLELLIEMVSRDLGVTLVPALAAAQLRRHGGIRLLHLANPPSRSLCLVSVDAAESRLLEISATLSTLIGLSQSS
jgi:LysR family hydrogen peroxide-inducible transcriptional activator